MESTVLVTNSLAHYDENNEKYANILNSAKYLRWLKSDTDENHNKVIFFDKNKKEIFRSRYEIIGIYTSIGNTWTWSWAISRFKKNNTNIARKIWNYGSILNPDNNEFLKQELITSRFRITHPIQLDIHVAIAAYLSKNSIIYKHFDYINEKKENFTNENIQEIVTKDEEYLLYYLFLLDKNEILEKVKSLESN